MEGGSGPPGSRPRLPPGPHLGLGCQCRRPPLLPAPCNSWPQSSLVLSAPPRPSSHLHCRRISLPPSSSFSHLVDCYVILLSTLSSPTRLQSQRSKSQGYMQLLLTIHMPKCPCADACGRVLALVFAWWKESPSETYHRGGCFIEA